MVHGAAGQAQQVGVHGTVRGYKPLHKLQHVRHVLSALAASRGGSDRHGEGGHAG